MHTTDRLRTPPKLNYRILLASVALGLLMWVADTALDAAVFFPDRNSGDMLFARSERHELYIRAVVLIAFTAFGFVLARVVALRDEAVARQGHTQRRIDHLNRALQAIRNINQLITREKDSQRLLQQACEVLVATQGYTTAWIELQRSDLYPAGIVCAAGDALGAGTAAFPSASSSCPCARAALGTSEVLTALLPTQSCATCGFSAGNHPDRVCPDRACPDRVFAVRLAQAERVWGVLVVVTGQGIDVDDHERSILSEVAGDLAFALHNIELEAVQQRTVSLLRASEKRFRNLFENAPVGVFQSTEGGELRTINAAAARIMGGDSPEEAEERLDWMVEHIYVHPEDRARFLDVLHRDGRVQDFEFEARRIDGQLVWVLMDAHFSGIEVRDTGGPSIHLIDGFARDITDRKRAEAALRESQRVLTTLMGNVPGMVYRCLDDPNWTMIFVSAGCHALTGYQPDQLVGNAAIAYEDVIHPDDRAYVRAQVASGLAGNRTYQIQYRIRTAAGEERWVWEQGRRVFPEDEDTSALLEGLIMDVTDLHQAQETHEQLLRQVRDQATRLEQVMNTVPEGVLLLDADHRVVLANSTAQRDLAHLAGAREGDTLTRVGDRDLPALLTPVGKDGWHEIKSSTRIFEAIAKPLQASDRSGWVMVLNDATLDRDRQRRSQRQEHLAAIGQLAAGIAHDFNNIIAVIVLYSQMAQRDPSLPPRLREQLGIITEESRRATRLIEQILDFGRRTSLERRPMDLVPFLKEEVRLLERMLPESIVVRLHYGQDDYGVNADPTRLQQALMNLALNARDAMPDGGHLDIALERIAIGSAGEPDLAPGEWIRIAVTDTGTGIAPDVRARLFEPFFTTKGARGSGLGLAQIHGIVGQHQGTIDVQTEVGTGTTFTLYLPALALPPVTPSPEMCEVASGHGETILLVEDNPAVRAALAGALTELGYAVTEADNGRRALELLLHRVPDLILSDAVMPEMGGRALLQELRRAGLNVPFVMLTGHATQEELTALRADGLAGWLPKPPALDALAELIATALGKPARSQ